MKDYTKLFEELYALDLSGFPFDETDTDTAYDYNLHRQYADGNKLFVLVGTGSALFSFIQLYKINHPRLRRRIRSPYNLADLMHYADYLTEWRKEHNEGEPVCFDEWYDNERVEDE